MKRLLTLGCIAMLFVTPALMAQTVTSGSDTQLTTLADNKPIENTSGSAVRQRAPGLIVTAALARHTALRDARLEAQHSGDNSNLLPEGSDSESTSSTSSTSGLLSNLLSSISPSLSTLLNDSTSSTSSTDFSNLPSEVLQMLSSFGISLSDLQNAKTTNSTSSTKQSSLTAQSTTTSTTTEESDFVVRWANAMLSTMFTTLTVAVQTTDFINLMKDIFRPLFGIEEESTSFLLPQRINFERFRAGSGEVRSGFVFA